MGELRWTLQAADELEAITEFIAADSPYYANLFAINVFAAVERLAMFPGSGRIVAEIEDPEVRETLSGSYRIIYRVRNDAVEVLTIYHCARLLDPSRFIQE
mgnify:CR=1 FL=1